MPIHRFGHQSCRGERSGGLSIGEFHVLSVRVFSDMSQEAHIHNIIEFLGQTGAGVGRVGDGVGMGLRMRLGLGLGMGMGSSNLNESALIYSIPHQSGTNPALIRTNPY